MTRDDDPPPMPWPARAACALALGLCLHALPAAAQPVPPGREGALARLVPPEPGARACYARRYDAAHLEAHPRQRVTRSPCASPITATRPSAATRPRDSATTTSGSTSE